MKKWVTISLIAALLTVIGVAGYNLLSGNKPELVSDSKVATPTPTQAGLSESGVAKHAVETDCWVIIDGNVYNVTEWLPKHPGGKEKIMKYCGKDASEGFLTKDSIPAKIHSEFAKTTLKGFLLGALSNGKEVVNMQELQIEDLVVGTGEEAVSGKTITVNYKGTLTDGTKFDSSYDRNQPFTFNLGAGQVIQGWEQGFSGMKVGGKRKLTIPPSLGYGSRDMGVIPSNSTLIFEVELLKVE